MRHDVIESLKAPSPPNDVVPSKWKRMRTGSDALKDFGRCLCVDG